MLDYYKILNTIKIGILMFKCRGSILIFFYLLPYFLIANGVSIGRSGHNIFPVLNDSIKLVSELLKMHQNGNVKTNCWYLLKNISNTPQKLTIGFYLGDTSFQHIYGSFTNIKVSVDGKEQKFELVVSEDKKTFSQAVYYAIWDMFFYPHQSKMVYVEQELEWGESDAESGDLLGLSESNLTYELNLASKWAGKPDRIEVYYDFGWDTGLVKDDTLWGISKLLIVKPDNFIWLSGKEIMWLFENTDSIENISITIKHYDYTPQKEEILEQFLERYNHYIYDDNFKEIPEIDILYDANKRLYTDKDMRCWKDVQIDELKKIKNRYEVYKIILRHYPAFLRNLIYAYHGYRFKEKIWNSLFSKAIWYKPKDSFSEQEFNEFERKNIAFIRNYEKKVIEYMKRK